LLSIHCKQFHVIPRQAAPEKAQVDREVQPKLSKVTPVGRELLKDAPKSNSSKAKSPQSIVSRLGLDEPLGLERLDTFKEFLERLVLDLVFGNLVVKAGGKFFERLIACLVFGDGYV
jgi:hypothetical protein